MQALGLTLPQQSRHRRALPALFQKELAANIAKVNLNRTLLAKH